jgi:hypothetical protein
MSKKKTTAKVKRKTSKPDVNAGLLVSDRVQLKDVRLIEFGCNQNQGASRAKKTYKIDHSTDVAVDKESGHVLVIAKFHFEAFAEGQPQKNVLKANATFALTYTIENFEGLTDKGFRQFADLNGIYNAWPYWREFMQNTIARLGMPPLVIPVFRIVQPAGECTAKSKADRKKIARKTAKKK